MCFLASERKNVETKMSEKVCECEVGCVVPPPKERLRALERFMWQEPFKRAARYGQ